MNDEKIEEADPATASKSGKISETDEGYNYAKLDKAVVKANIKEPKNPSVPIVGIPNHIVFLQIFAGISRILGVLAFLAFIFTSWAEVNKRASEPTSLMWLIALALTIESFIAYGLLNAIADIAMNMIEVGNYVRHLAAEERHKLKNEKPVVE